MGLFLDTTRAIITSLKTRSEELAATALLEETLRVINGFAEPHWRAHSISELPDMIRELARDRDDFKTMSIAYRENLANAEARIRELESERSGHTTWCGVNSACTCEKDDDD